VSDRDSSSLRELQRSGLLPGVSIIVEPGTRNASLLVRICGATEPIRLSQRLAGEILVTPNSIFGRT